MIKTNNNIPLIILPCSADKLCYPAKAVDFYLGKGYLPVLRNRINLHKGRDYNLAFMSAKHGLVMADEVLSPYDLKITTKQSKWLVDHKSKGANDRLKQINPCKVIACLPSLYLSTFEQMVAGYEPTLNIIKPAKSSGIGFQRQFLSVELDKISESTVTFFVFHNLNSKRPTITTVIEVRAGDVFTPYLGGVGDNRSVGTPVKVKQIITTNDVPVVIDEHNNKYSCFDISNGLNAEQREAAMSYGGSYEPGIDLTPITTSLSQINRDVVNANRRIA